MSLHAYRASLLWFPDPASHHVQFEQDGLLVIERGADGVARIKAIGPHALLLAESPQVPCTDWRGRWIAPGFVDLHIHYAQTDVIASPADALLPWLNHYTFPQETRFADPAHAHEVAHFFFDELLRNGVTTALTFATSHTASVDAFFQEAQRRQLRMLGGRVLQDRHSPDGLRDRSAQQSLYETEALIARWHGVDRLGYAITPRFAPTSSEAQLRGAGELAASHPSVWVQTHVAENADEIQWVAELFPQARRHHLQQGLASDVGGGTSFSPFHTMHAAYTVGRQSAGKNGHSLSAENLWWLHTAGAAQALGLGGVVGNLAEGCDADFVVLNPAATPLLARRTSAAESLQAQLFAMIVLGDDRLIERVVVNGD
ncbi:MAG: guanine deaminase [Betaproteobacteria bacterium]|nr:guanine deaminase [Betaproteobacteria bacterium]